MPVKTSEAAHGMDGPSDMSRIGPLGGPGEVTP
jgi:hypothetical protein